MPSQPARRKARRLSIIARSPSSQPFRAAASIIAKHTRDRIMIAHAETWPHYGWHSNKGYGCAAHLKALREHGPAPIHRRSFAPVAQAELPFALGPAAESFESHHNG